mmetsp:Transcript_47257/g.145542  ORF Transcript_47257/g.145542 Transcript_47257/m.145542 type:complete len:420 (-) Transcript_47257:104-1363(-)
MTVTVKAREGSVHEVLVNVGASHQCSGQKLCELYLLTALKVHLVQHAPEVCEVRGEVCKDRLDLLKPDAALPVHIEQKELLPEVGPLLGWQDISQQAEGQSAKARSSRKTLQARQDAGVEAGTTRRVSTPEPWVIQCLSCSEPLLRIADEQLTHKGGGSTGEVREERRELRSASADLPQDVPVGAKEGRRPGQEHVSDDAGGPHISLWRVGAREDLWGNVVHGPARLRHPGAGAARHGKAKVDELDEVRPLVRVKEILEFQVSVSDVPGMEVGHCEQYLIHHGRCVLLRIPPSSCQVVIELAPTQVFHDYVQHLFCFVDRVQLGNVRMIHLQVQLNLVLQVLAMSGRQPALLETLHRILSAISLAFSQAHGVIHASPKDLVEDRVVILQGPRTSITARRRHTAFPCEHLVGLHEQAASC